MAWSGPRTTSSRVTSTHAWRKLRQQVLERDRHQCQTRGPDCIGHATQVDHPHNTAAGGTHASLDNAQAICEPCHTRKTQAEAQRARRPRTNRRPPEQHPGLIPRRGGRGAPRP